MPDQAAAAQNAGGGVANMEALSKRCLHLIKVALKPDLWGLKAELKLQWLEKALASAVNVSFDIFLQLCNLQKSLFYRNRI